MEGVGEDGRSAVVARQLPAGGPGAGRCGDGIDARGETEWIKARGNPMPLTTTADLGHHNKNRNIVRLFMENETKERIRCGVTIRALEIFKPDLDTRTDDPLTTFNKHRAHIESSASAKYDRQDFEPEDGQTILVTVRDL